MGRTLFIDYGRVRIGLAISDENSKIAFPLTLVLQQKDLQETFKEIQKKTSHNITKIVIGLPILLNGKEGEMAKEVKEFAAKIGSYFGVPIAFWDERLSSSLADRELKELNLSRKKRTELLDSTAAAMMLQSYLDAQK